MLLDFIYIYIYMLTSAHLCVPQLQLNNKNKASLLGICYSIVLSSMIYNS